MHSCAVLRNAINTMLDYSMIGLGKEILPSTLLATDSTLMHPHFSIKHFSITVFKQVEDCQVHVFIVTYSILVAYPQANVIATYHSSKPVLI